MQTSNANPVDLPGKTAFSGRTPARAEGTHFLRQPLLTSHSHRRDLNPEPAVYKRTKTVERDARKRLYFQCSSVCWHVSQALHFGTKTNDLRRYSRAGPVFR